MTHRQAYFVVACCFVVVLAAVTWLALASVILCLQLGTLAYVEWPSAVTTWWDIYQDYGMAVPVKQSAWASVGILCVIAVLIAANFGRPMPRRMLRALPFFSGPRPIERGVTDNHGHAAWMDRRGVLREFSDRPHPIHGGKVIGRLPDGTTLYDHLQSGRTGLTVEFSGSGSGKTSSLITMAARFRGPKIINDPSGEIAPMMWEHLLYDLHERVWIVSPDPEPRDEQGNIEPWADLVARYNPLDWIDPTQPYASMHVHSVARAFFDEQGEERKGDNVYFRDAASSLIAIILGHILWSDDTPKTLVTMRRIISMDPDRLLAYLKGVAAGSPCQMARAAIGPMFYLLEKAEKTFSNVWEEVNQKTMWLTDPDLAGMVAASDFPTSCIFSREPCSIIFHLPLHLQQNHPGVARVLYGSFVAAKIASRTTNWVLLLPDETWTIGRAKWMEIVIAAGRKHGLAMHAPWLDVGTLERIWGGKPGRSFWLSNARCIMISQLNDPAAARDVSDACGATGVMAYSEGDNSGVQGGTGLWGRVSRGHNQNRHEIKRPLMFLHEVIQDLERDDILVLGIKRPLLLKRALWWHYPDLRHSIEPSPYEREEAA